MAQNKEETVVPKEGGLVVPITDKELDVKSTKVTSNNLEEVSYSIVIPDGISYKSIKDISEPVGDDDAFQIHTMIRKEAESKAIRKKYKVEGTLSSGARYGDMRMYQSQIKPKLNVDITKLTDAQKMEIINTKTAGGNKLNVVLWNSGFLITLRPMDNLQIINFEKRLGSIILLKAAMTGGLVMTGIEYQYREVLMELIMEHLDTSTLKVPNLMDLTKYIVPEDWPILENGIMSLMYPDGIETTRPCSGIIDGKPCFASHIIKMYNDNIVKVDWSRITPAMFKIVGSRIPNSLSPSDLKAYREALNPIDTGEITLKTDGDDLLLSLKWPNLQDIAAMGGAWFNKLRDSVNEVLNTDYEEDYEEEEVARRSLNTASGSVLAYLDSIKLGDIVVTDKDLIYNKLNVILPIGDNNKLIYNKLETMGENRAVAFIGVSNFKCGACKTAQEVDDTGYVIINGYGLLFESLALRIRKLIQETEKK